MEQPLHMETIGRGTNDIVVCAGLLQTTINWKGMARMYPKWRWILFDARGQGKSPLRSEPYHLDDHVDDLLDIIRRAKTNRPTLLGFSHGGHVAIRAAARVPDLFSRLLVVSSTSRSNPRRALMLRSWMECLHAGGIPALAWATLPILVGPRMLDQFTDPAILVHAIAKRNNASGLKAMFRGIRDYPQSWEEDCSRIEVPVHIMRGTLDPIVDDLDSANFCAWIRHCTTEDLPGCGHTAVLEDPTSLAHVLA